jgi:hypothetical protein
MTVLDKNGLVKAKPSVIYCHGGGTIDLLDPDPADVDIYAIGYHLSNQRRFTGASPVTVAEHCCLVSDLVVVDSLKLPALLHDAPEAYIGDLNRPLKSLDEMKWYTTIEERLQVAIADALCLRAFVYTDFLKYEPIKEADEKMLWAEAKLFLPELGKEMPDPGFDCPRPKPWGRKQAFREFMTRYYNLT